MLTRVESHATDLFKMGAASGNNDKEERKKSKKKKQQPRSAKEEGSAKNDELLAKSQAADAAAGSSSSSSVPFPPPSANSSMEDLKTMKPRIPISESTPNFNQLLLDRKEEDAALVSNSLSTSGAGGPASSAALDAPMLKKWLTIKGLNSAEIERVHYDDLWGCFTRNFGKGFVLGFFGRTGINVMYALIHALRTRTFPKLFSRETLLFSNEHGAFCFVFPPCVRSSS